jgi:hypothetical protein
MGLKYLFKPRNRQDKTKFEVPKEGGALQTIEKDKEGNIKLTLASKIKLTHDTYLFRYALPKDQQTFGLPIGNHVIFSEVLNTKNHESEQKELV